MYSRRDYKMTLHFSDSMWGYTDTNCPCHRSRCRTTQLESLVEHHPLCDWAHDHSSSDQTCVSPFPMLLYIALIHMHRWFLYVWRSVPCMDSCADSQRASSHCGGMHLTE